MNPDPCQHLDFLNKSLVTELEHRDRLIAGLLKLLNQYRKQEQATRQEIIAIGKEVDRLKEIEYNRTTST